MGCKLSYHESLFGNDANESGCYQTIEAWADNYFVVWPN